MNCECKSNLLPPFSKYHSIPTHMTISEKEKLKELAASLPSESVVLEIGSYLGASTCFIASGLETLSFMYAVDTWQNDAMADIAAADVFHNFLNNTYDLRHKIHPVRGKSRSVSISLKEPFFDMMFFDGDHSLEGVQTDWNSWGHKRSPNGCLVVFHDFWAEGVKEVYLKQVLPLAKYHDSLPNMVWAWL